MTIKKRVLVVGTYPIKNPAHGGQKRVAAIVEEYRKVFSHVKYVAVFVREHYPQYSSDDIYLTGDLAQRVLHDRLTSDIQVGEAIANDPKVRRQVERMLQTFKPDIIEIEQVFPYMGLEKVLKDLGMTPKIVHSSHNVEVAIKDEVLTIANAPQKEIDRALKTIEKTETKLAKTADLVVAVSQEDGEWYEKHGSDSYVLAPNGIAAPTFTESGVQHWKNIFEKEKIRQTVVFIGSAHMPNMQGIRQMIGFRLGFLPPDTRLILAGGAGKHLQLHFDSDDIRDLTFWRRAISAGIISEDHLSGLIKMADVILLPIVKGGGSNLKTAEAILSGKKVVGTSFAFRGYEQYMDLANIWIADTPDGFKKAIVEALNTPLKERTKKEEKLAEQVQWHYCLQEMINTVKEL
jgi:hypothetical protein